MKADTHLWRQVHPTFIQDDQITSQVFAPTPKDQGKLSVYDGDQISAEDSWSHFTAPKNDKPAYRSIGVVSVTVGECEANSTLVTPDPTAFEEHVLIDFGELTKPMQKTVAKELSRLARVRGWMYQPPASPI